MGKNIYIFNDREFHSLRELSKYVGINEKTLTARLRRGMSIEAACIKNDLRCSYHMDSGDNREKSLTQICHDNEKDFYLVNNRLKYGYSLQDALNKPKKVSKQGKPITVNGILYNSIASALRRLNLENKEGTIRSRLRAGMPPDQAFRF